MGECPDLASLVYSPIDKLTYSISRVSGRPSTSRPDRLLVI